MHFQHGIFKLQCMGSLGCNPTVRQGRGVCVCVCGGGGVF